MKKIIIITMLILVLSILLGTVFYNMNPLVKSEEKIREHLFESTPLGTEMIDVIKFIESKRKWEIDYISYEQGFLNQGITPRKIIGEKSIRVELGDYGFVLETSVTVFYGFDENSKLIDIWVWKTTDSV